MKKRLKVYIGLVVLALICNSVYFLYPSRRAVFDYNRYTVTESGLYKEPLCVTIHPNQYPFEAYGKHEINQLIHHAHSTDICLSEIRFDDERVTIRIDSNIKWSFSEGECLLQGQHYINDQGTPCTVSSFASYTIVNEKGENADYTQCGGGPNDLISFTYDKDEFYKHDSLTFNFGGYYLHRYKLKPLKIL
ncbi:hypothetical protein HZI73_12395 [Vallitalea pronyensis]|uniref:Uncharacterized protein n=1 Tax=Vallitalea pronyensis TaxID=1348613 RepID=A0A8J8SH63_9FIRM|nr:hypothetical protein [Vallitalea pronyensis]QUI23038.1 hypothetical protein HZI73_12395 [Vallitalea pronyensis]